MKLRSFFSFLTIWVRFLAVSILTAETARETVEPITITGELRVSPGIQSSKKLRDQSRRDESLIILEEEWLASNSIHFLPWDSKLRYSFDRYIV